MGTLESLNAQIAKLTKKAQAMRSKGVQRVVALMQKLGVDVEDLPKRKGRKPGGAAAKSTGGVAKYRDPATGKTWTGHGRAPEWIKGAANRDQFLIDKSGSFAAPPPTRTASKKTAKKAPGKAAPGKRARKAPAKAVKVVKAA